MLFNSLSFLLIFLPIVLTGFFICRRYGNVEWIFVWLFLCSAAFYGAWEPRYIFLLVSSILFNYFIAIQIARSKSRALLAFGIVVNLASLAYFKYLNFILQTWSSVLGSDFQPVAITLPLGISFITFIQIAFLVDVFRDRSDDLGFPKYALFVSYFPHLIAGPIIHHKEVMSQFTDARLAAISANHVVGGIALILCGLFKKVIIADTMASYSTPAFHLAAQLQPISFLDAWGALLAFTFQIYFDFSGYSDIAIGLSRLFGVRLPVNFDSPYKATSIIDFWRRWHITLSRFLRDYLYVPLGGNRHGVLRRYANLMIVMLLGGLWHGASWMFVIWGGLHGAYLIINHAFQFLKRQLGDQRVPLVIASRLFSLLVFPAVMLSWVFFRSESWLGAKLMLRAMLGFNGILLPEKYQALLGSLSTQVMSTFHMHTGDLVTFGSSRAVLWMVLVTAFVFLLPNSQQLLAEFDRNSGFAGDLQFRPPLIAFRPTALSAVVAAGVGIAVLAAIYSGVPSEFIYFQF
ncbi:MBOAT family O-acyltransferase [Bradyrhizobium guangdongense]|uniref:Probable alginate O-acetylase AlgI n=1 Tax=Bradyrhizobium guangdongense TaxID=1325090 RepID=A0A410V4Q9_9BRAD|nr:MBOAT family O-acyltransferase [Bradyrhizobium guangdongense]QAU38617.1 MBOAT family protein [Bradyrhizobium guangdongense]QOZ59676.1 MBOAT family protein [Bradyrhizobium guangdongense]GGI29192.1 alginate O-acetylation protein [Bradyrhizobium guangdongense]